jgi:hypothetical protein
MLAYMNVITATAGIKSNQEINRVSSKSRLPPGHPDQASDYPPDRNNEKAGHVKIR